MTWHKRWRAPPPSCRSGLPRIHGSTPACVVLDDYYHTLDTTLLLHLCSSVCRRKGADLCIVQEPLLARSIASIRAFTPFLGYLVGGICSAMWPWWAELRPHNVCTSSYLFAPPVRAVQAVGTATENVHGRAR